MSRSSEFHNYRIFGLVECPGGVAFQSKVPNLDQRPDLWSRECPFPIGHFSEPHVVKEEIDA